MMADLFLLSDLGFNGARWRALSGRAYMIDIKGYICIIGSVARRSEEDMEAEGRPGKKIEKI